MVHMSSIPFIVLAWCISPIAIADESTVILPSTIDQIHQTVARATVYLQTECAAWLSTRKCAACHHVPMPLWALIEADQQG